MNHERNFLLLYGTQTGQAKAIAETLKLKSEQQGLRPRLCCVSSVGRQFQLEQEKLVVIVISTVGEGECPDSAQKFCRLLKRELRPGSLSSLRFAVLGLGDTNHNVFCGCAKFIEKKLTSLSAEKFYPTGLCDDEIGLEVVAEPWIAGVVSKLVELLSVDSEPTSDPPDLCGLSVQPKPMSDSDEAAESGGNSQTVVGIQRLSCSIDLTPEPKEEDEEEDIEEEEGELNDEDKVSGSEEEDDGVDSTDEEAPAVEQYKPDQTFYTFEKCQCVWGKPSLVHSDRLKAVKDLHVPPNSFQSPQIACAFTHEFVNEEKLPLQNGCEFPSQASAVFSAPVVDRKLLTDPKAKKQKYLISLDLEGSEFTYEPGDALYFLCPNPDAEVNWLLYRLNLGILSYNVFEVEPAVEDGPSPPKIPKHVPAKGNAFYVFKYCLNIRHTPSQSMLRMMADACEVDAEKRRLLELSSTEGRDDYVKFVRNPGLSVLDVLHAFPSCLPAVEALIEAIPRLKPRAFSFANSPTTHGNRADFVFSMVEIPCKDGRFYARRGIATGYLQGIPLFNKVQVFLKRPTDFRLPSGDLSAPLIMVGPGTGVAPFFYFLEHIEKSVDVKAICERWLFFGCRQEKLDYICREQMEGFEKRKVLSHLVVSFSEEADESQGKTRHVQDSIRKHGAELMKLLSETKAKIYVCGDIQRMSKDISQAFVDVLVSAGGKTQGEAEKCVDEWKACRRYVQDLWV